MCINGGQLSVLPKNLLDSVNCHHFNRRTFHSDLVYLAKCMFVIRLIEIKTNFDAGNNGIARLPLKKRKRNRVHLVRTSTVTFFMFTFIFLSDFYIFARPWLNFFISILIS